MSHKDEILVSKIVKMGIPRAETEQIVKNLSAEQKSNTLEDARALRAIIDIYNRPR
jgi:hypothetical protein